MTLERSLPPRDNPPNDNGPGPNVPPISVGPTSSTGEGNDQVMTLAPFVQAWSGWPDGWATPAWGGWQADWQSRIDVVFACADLNSSVLAAMPAYLTKGVVPQPPLPWLTNPEPLRYNSWNEFIRELFWGLFIVGEQFVLATSWYADGYPQRFMLVDPWYVKVEWLDGRRRYTIGGEDVTADIKHLVYKWDSQGLHGIGPLSAGGARLLAVEALTRYAGDLASKGGIPWAVLKYPRRVNRAQMAEIQADWINARRSAAGAPAILADGVDLEPLTAMPKDMALNELQQFNEARIAVLMRVPPGMVGLPSGDSMTYSTQVLTLDIHWRTHLRPVAAGVMAALSNWLVPAGTNVELNRDDYVKPDPLARSQMYEAYIRMGVLTPQDVQVAERFVTADTVGSLTITNPVAVSAPPAPQEVVQ